MCFTLTDGFFGKILQGRFDLLLDWSLESQTLKNQSALFQFCYITPPYYPETLASLILSDIPVVAWQILD